MTEQYFTYTDIYDIMLIRTKPQVVKSNTVQLYMRKGNVYIIS